MRAEYLKKGLFVAAYYFTIKRYTSAFKSEYFSRTKQIASNFYDRFFLILFRLQKLQKQFRWKDFYKEYLYKPIAYLHTNTNYQVTSLKGDGSFRYFYIPNLYLVVLYEIYVSYLIRLVEEAMKSGLTTFLIDWKYFSFAHQISNSWTIQYVDLWKKYLEYQEKLINQHNFYLKTDIKSFYDLIPHDNLCQLLSQFLKGYLKREKYVEYGVDNYLLDFYDILFKVAKYSNKGLPQGMRWSDYLAVLYLWLLFFYERERLGLSFVEKTYWKMGIDTNFILYSDDILFVGNTRQDLFNNVNKVIQILHDYGLVINQNKTTDIMKQENYKYLKEISIQKIRKKDSITLIKLKEYIKEILKNKNIDEISWANFKTYFKWCFLLDFDDIQDKLELKEIFQSIYGESEFLESPLDSQRVGILLLTISESSVSHIFNIIKADDEDWEIENIFIQFVKKYKDLLSDSTFLGILQHFCSDLDKNNRLKECVIQILKEKGNAVINCFVENDNKNFFLPYCKAVNFSGLEYLLSIVSENYSFDWNSENYEENIIWLKLNNLFGISLDKINFSKLKILNIWNETTLWKEEFIYQIAEVIDSLLYQKYRNPIYFMKTATFISDFFSLINQLITILVSIKKKQFFSCHIAFSKDSDVEMIIVWEDKSSPKESFYQNDIQITMNDRLFFYYVQKKRAGLQHKESQSKVDFTQVSYDISKYENSEIFLNSAKLILEDLCSQITNKLEHL